MSRITSQVVAAIVFGFVSLVSVSSTVAQATYEYDSEPVYHNPTPPYPVEMGFSQDHSSTFAEGVQRGRAALIQAWGNYELSNSQARILWEQGRALRRDNNLKLTEAVQAQHKMWLDYSIEKRKAREARMAEGREILNTRRAAVYGPAFQLSSTELDPMTGAINWPTALESTSYAADRARVEELFRQHVGYGKGEAGTAREIARTVDMLKRKLQSEVGSMSSDEYLASQKFLRGLKYAAEGIVQG